MNIKLIALDLDGTLTDDKKQISDYTAEILHKAAEQGAAIALASGRPMLGILPVAKRLGLDKIGGYILAYNGGHILDCKTGKDIFHVTFPSEYIQEAADFAAAHKVPIVSYDNTYIITEGPVDAYVEHESYNNNAPVKVVENLPAFLNFPIVKMVICGNPDVLAPVEAEMAEQFRGRLDIYRAEPVFLEVMPKGINKASGLQRLMEHLGITSQELMACGDANNDIPMLKQAKLSVAVGNASAPVKEVCAFISKTNNEDGVAYAVKKFVLDGEELPG